jgi:hypothetical protein
MRVIDIWNSTLRKNTSWWNSKLFVKRMEALILFAMVVAEDIEKKLKNVLRVWTLNRRTGVLY